MMPTSSARLDHVAAALAVQPERSRLMVEKPVGMPRWLAFLLAWLAVSLIGVE